jgi:hypothetical protein
MKSINRLAVLSAAVCVVMLAFGHNASAERIAGGVSTGVPVPDGGATVMLLGVALGALGMARRFLKS